MVPEGNYMFVVKGEFTSAGYRKMLAELSEEGEVHSTFFDKMGKQIDATAMFKISSEKKVDTLLAMLRNNLGVSQVSNLNEEENNEEIKNDIRH